MQSENLYILFVSFLQKILFFNAKEYSRSPLIWTEFSIFTEYATVGYMAKRIQMRKQRFVAIQKIASEKKVPVDCPPLGDSHTLSKMGTLSRCPPGRPSVSYSFLLSPSGTENTLQLWMFVGQSLIFGLKI